MTTFVCWCPGSIAQIQCFCILKIPDILPFLVRTGSPHFWQKRISDFFHIKRFDFKTFPTETTNDILLNSGQYYMLFWSRHTCRNLAQPSIMRSLLCYTLDQIVHMPQTTNYALLKWPKQNLTGLFLYGIFMVYENRIKQNIYMAFTGLLH